MRRNSRCDSDSLAGNKLGLTLRDALTSSEDGHCPRRVSGWDCSCLVTPCQGQSRSVVPDVVGSALSNYGRIFTAERKEAPASSLH